MKFFLMTFFIFVGCTKEYELQKKNGVYFLENIDVGIENIRHIEWKVGKTRSEIVSRGMRIDTKVPHINSEAISFLRSKFGIDGWIYKFEREDRGRSEHLGYVYYPLANISGSTKTFSLNIYYHASVVSNRFRAFHCPAFDHRLLLDDIDVSTQNNNYDNNIYIRPKETIRAKVSKLQFTTHIFSAGTSMIGDYSVQMALYNSNQKKIYSNWYKVKNYIPVKKELNVSVPSCIGVKEENDPNSRKKNFNIQDLEIK